MLECVPLLRVSHYINIILLRKVLSQRNDDTITELVFLGFAGRSPTLPSDLGYRQTDFMEDGGKEGKVQIPAGTQCV